MELQDNEFHIKQATARASIRMQQNRPKPFDFLILKTRDPVELLLELERANLQELLEETEQFHTYKKSLWWECIITMIRYMLQPKSNIQQDIMQMFTNKSLDELIQLENQVKPKLELDWDYWNAVLNSIEYFKAKRILTVLYEKEDHVEQKEIIQEAKTRFISEPYYQEMEPNIIELTREQNIYVETQDEFDNYLNNFRSCLKNDLEKYGNKKTARNFGSTKDVTFIPKASKDLQNDEKILASEILFDDSYQLVGKYTLRKPLYFVRVQTGLVWINNKTSTKTIVTGYKFNVFYPDLIDQLLAPIFRLEDCPDDVDKQLIAFVAGPPYEEIAFKIVKKEWDFSNSKDYISNFENGILQLWFKFKK